VTLPDEEERSLVYAHDFLLELLDPKKTPRVPRDIRRRAGLVLRHFPSRHRVKEIYKVKGVSWL
jgi:hypothetical protein